MSINVLVIDDNENIRYTIDEICKFQNWNALLAEDCYNALAIIESKRPIDVILVDYHLPKVDGIKTVKKIRELLPKVPIIVLTIDEHEEVMQRFMDAGADDYSLKPIKALDLISRIKVHIKHSTINKYYNETEKGISKVTLETIKNYLNGMDNYIDIEQIVANTNIKQKTVYRYIEYMIKENIVDVKYDYQKVGRPKTLYKMKS